jgi:hypothetical protein
MQKFLTFLPKEKIFTCTATWRIVCGEQKLIAEPCLTFGLLTLAATCVSSPNVISRDRCQSFNYQREFAD